MEKKAIALVVFLTLLVVAIPLLGSQLTAQKDVIELHARMPENGDWSPSLIRGTIGEPIKLRMTSDDVVHGFAVGQTSLPEVEIFPGKYAQVELVFDKPGEYTFYCTRWCGANHWRMRGTIVIDGEESATQEAIEQPAFLKLNLDLDAPHLANNLPVGRPDAARGKSWADFVPSAMDSTFVWSISPESMWKKLTMDPKTSTLDDQTRWDIVAWAISRGTGADGIAQGKALYTQNCLACHGETGKGDGVMVRNLPPLNYDDMGGEAVRPPDFSDPAVLLGASPALLEGKIIRGGMGTGMPYWGDIFTSQQIRDLVLYLYSFQMDFANLP